MIHAYQIDADGRLWMYRPDGMRESRCIHRAGTCRDSCPAWQETEDGLILCAVAGEIPARQIQDLRHVEDRQARAARDAR